jgi:hypothetical protein
VIIASNSAAGQGYAGHANEKQKRSDCNEDGVPGSARRCRFELVWAVGFPDKIKLSR